ncbi:MAG: flagellar hook-basal body complex protein FliE [Limnochordia bacterium]|jgi:flagellar hook-basal body complex protein FliE
MRITPVDTAKASASRGEVNRGASFGESLKEALRQVNKELIAADAAAAKVATGQSEDIHQAMIQMEKAHMSLQLTITIRNKLLEAYQEISRMQI